MPALITNDLLLLVQNLCIPKKYHSDGCFDSFKARLVFRGDKWYDIYNNKTYMPGSVRLLLAVEAAEDLELESADVHSAFYTVKYLTINGYT